MSLRFFLAVSAISLIVAASSAAAPRPGTTLVPDVIGLSFSKASNALIRDRICVSRLTTEIRGTTRSNRGQPRIIQQMPKAGSRISVPGSVTLVARAPIYIGPSNVVANQTLPLVTNPPVVCPVPALRLVR